MPSKRTRARVIRVSLLVVLMAGVAVSVLALNRIPHGMLRLKCTACGHREDTADVILRELVVPSAHGRELIGYSIGCRVCDANTEFRCQSCRKWGVYLSARGKGPEQEKLRVRELLCADCQRPIGGRSASVGD